MCLPLSYTFTKEFSLGGFLYTEDQVLDFRRDCDISVDATAGHKPGPALSCSAKKGPKERLPYVPLQARYAGDGHNVSVR